jgi:hypothetical protein
MVEERLMACTAKGSLMSAVPPYVKRIIPRSGARNL